MDCVHGHFLAFKYKMISGQMPCSFVTWVRNPLARLMSHYYYWVESYDPRTAVGLHRRCMEERWSFERFCLGEEFRDIQSQYLWSVPLCTFEFVGITDFTKRTSRDFRVTTSVSTWSRCGSIPSELR